MELKEKVAEALREALSVMEILLDDDEGISGYVISEQFRGVTALDRQRLIHHALRDSKRKFSKAEKKRILCIAALTPVEYASLGPRTANSR